ncbi:MAG: ATP-binding protein, partial [Spirochaetales bacterium]|nr:ATP-binding protein [Spirochaetales bacterium]
MDYINRKPDISERLGQKSVLLLGPRQTGKTSYIKNQLGTAVKAKWDLLNTRTRIQLERDPRLLYEQIAALDMDPQSEIVVIDEIQKVPALLDVVHEVIEEKRIRFLLTGSSARKLRKEGVNLLGGRASKATLLPFVYEELKALGEKDLDEIFLRGMLPPAWDDPDPDGFLDDYISTYLQEEIASEGVTRNLPGFGNFLQTAALQSGEQLNYSNMANDIGMSRQSIANWYQVLEDTLLGFQLPPWKKSAKRKSVSITKFYLFDVGVTRRLSGIDVPSDTQSDFGRLFENYIAMELKAWHDYNRRKETFCYWRTENGTEVDFVLGDGVAIEVKATRNPSPRNLDGLRKIGEERDFRHRILVCRESMPRMTDDGILILPWQ